MTPNSDFQFMYKESGNSMTTAKLQSARLLPHWRPSNVTPAMLVKESTNFPFMLGAFNNSHVIVTTATSSTLKTAANLTQILNFKAKFLKEFELFGVCRQW